ncbi:hypothetical protein CEXT_544131 [Caerostris extrusa]|uniref:Uncharacterized protein n=1 Tax=Caerostris extrusa TaxID=172846 RepID=A0AAV4VGZ0_CAEEX|nr:hypothetical protein CEXT_544131 [Caerostris extrusa]
MSRSIIDSTIVTPTSSTEKSRTPMLIRQPSIPALLEYRPQPFLRKFIHSNHILKFTNWFPTALKNQTQPLLRRSMYQYRIFDIYNLVPSISRDRMTYLPKSSVHSYHFPIFVN